MKRVAYSASALTDIARHRSKSKRIMAKVRDYAETGAGNVKKLAARNGYRLRVGDFRVLFDEDETTITVFAIGPRSDIYER